MWTNQKNILFFYCVSSLTGKTTFLKALAGQLIVGSAHLEGDILYNGDPISSGKYLVGKIATYADEKDHNDPAYAPILAKNLSGLPPAVMITAEFDPLRDEGIAYAEQLRKAGVKVWSQCFGGEIHCLIPAPDDGAATKTYQQIVSTAMNEVMKVK